MAILGKSFFSSMSSQYMDPINGSSLHTHLTPMETCGLPFSNSEIHMCFW